jgi:hypothetical protein
LNLKRPFSDKIHLEKADRSRPKKEDVTKPGPDGEDVSEEIHQMEKATGLSTDEAPRRGRQPKLEGLFLSKNRI